MNKVLMHILNLITRTVFLIPGVVSPPFLKRDSGGLLSGYLIPPYPPGDKGEKKFGFT
jgi:hypothetical protein